MKTAEKHGLLHGGSLTEEVLESSKSVLRRYRGSGSTIGEGKQCNQCKQVKSTSEFYLKTQKTGNKYPQSTCKECTKARQKATHQRKRRESLEKNLCVNCHSEPIDFGISKVRCADCHGRSRLSLSKTRQKARESLFAIYGGKECACCGENIERFLCFDHINNDGADHRLSIGVRSNGRGFSDVASLHRSLKSQGFPPIIQVLCFNCNMGKQLNDGVCPHKEVE